MHYSFRDTVTSHDTSSDPLVSPLKMGSGIITGAKIYFPYGCNGSVHCQIWDSAGQLLPTNADGDYALDGSYVEASLHYDLSKMSNQLYLIAWGDDVIYDHNIEVHIEVRGIDEPQPYDIMALMVDTLNRLIDVIKSLI